MRPLFFSVLKYFTDGKEACRSDVQDALRAQYGNFKAFKDHAMDEALMTACSNGLIDESRYELARMASLLSIIRPARKASIRSTITSKTNLKLVIVSIRKGMFHPFSVYL